MHTRAHAAPGSDWDQVPDWFEQRLAGTLTLGAGSDLDGDGFNLLQEYSRGQSPFYTDSLMNNKYPPDK